MVQVAYLIFSAMMAWRMLQRRTLARPRGLGVWLLFVVWSLAGIAVLQVLVPNSVPGDNNNRYLLWGLRCLGYAEVSVVLLYVSDLSRRIDRVRVSRALAPMFVTIVLGGLAGSAAGALPLRSLTEVLLGPVLPANAFLTSLIHPVLADRHVYLGAVTYRPSAPFPYANEWGLNFAAFLPFFVHAWLRRDAGWRRVAGPVLLLVSLVPVVYSSNRALWVVLMAMAALAVGTFWRSFNIRVVLAAGTLVAVALVAVVVSPLGTAVADRLDGHNSNAGRARLTATSIEGLVHSSPVVGAGATRRPAGGSYSIAAGNSTTCPTCLPPSFGTQGVLWSVLFTTGFVGALLFVGFFVSVLWRHRRQRAAADRAAQLSLVAFLATCPVYDWSIPTVVAVMAAVGLLAGGDVVSSRPVVRPAARLVLPVMVTGALGGLVAFGLAGGTTYTATASVYLPDTTAAGGATIDQTLDNEAQYVHSQTVSRAVAAATGHRPVTGPVVTAQPNSRILLVRYAAPDAARAEAASRRAAAVLLADLTGRLERDRRITEALLRQQARTAAGQITTLNDIGGLGVPGSSYSLVQRSAVISQLYQLEQSRSAELTTGVSGRVTGVATGVLPQRRQTFVVSGAMLGLLLTCCLAVLADVLPVRTRTRRLACGGSLLGLPQVQVVAGRADPWSAREQLRPGPAEFVGADHNDVEGRAVAAALRADVRRTEGPFPAATRDLVLVSSEETSWRVLRQAHHRWRSSGWSVVGLVLVLHPHRRHVRTNPYRELR
ncbi:hypothetical protein [Nocardioides mangrovicus]|uniref:hypothetical protein n=1 Tax=Nocardioides mangrovicus TaxID=2478913 RepID=UPI0011C3832D|nr:hypothetical protein [Nocardioides mangrovicus]